MNNPNVGSRITVAFIATAPETEGPVGDLFRIARSFYLGTGVATSSWFLTDGPGRTSWQHFTNDSKVLGDLDRTRAAQFARPFGAVAAGKVKGLTLKSWTSQLPDSGVDIAVLDEGITGGILSHLRPAVTVVRWTGRDVGNLERVTAADLVLVAPDAARVSEAPSGPRHELRVGPLGDEARILGHRSLRDKRRIELGLSPSTPLILGTGGNLTGVINALTASELHGVPLWWIDDPAHFKVTEQLAAEVAAGSRPELQGVFASHDRSTLGAADFLIADSVETLDSSLRDFAELSGVQVASAADAPELIAGFDSADSQTDDLRGSRIRHAEQTIDAGAAATALLKLVGPQGMNLSGDHHDN